MKVAIAIDSFKGSLSSVAAGNAAAEGVRRVFPAAECAVRPLADGGEGTVDALVAGLGGELRRVTVTGPAGKPTVAKYGLLPDGVAVMEMAEAAGITLVSGEEKNPLYTTTYGVGEMILDAVKNGAKTFVIGIGGSATNDGGAGMLQALGFRLLDAEGNDIPRGGAGLAKLEKIEPGDFRSQISDLKSQISDFRSQVSGLKSQVSDFGSQASGLKSQVSSLKSQVSGLRSQVSGLRSQNSGLRFRIACDVTNPLCGPKGASAVFGPQKGATPEMVAQLDAALAHFAEVESTCRSTLNAQHLTLNTHHLSLASSPGAGAAGGLGFAFKAFLGAELVPGVDLILNETRLEDFVKDADVVITGEGRLDGQTVMGKAPIGVARLAKKYGKRVLAFCGCVGDGVEAVNAAGIDAYFPILRKLVTLDEALDVPNAAANLSDTVEQAFRILKSNRSEEPRP